MLDLLVVGCGPVGAVAANLAGVAGLSTLVLERETEPFPLPRAIHFDAHIMRILQQAGLATALEPQTRVWRRSTFYGADSRPIRVHDWPTDKPYGWDPHYLFYQPTVETLLRDRMRAHRNVDLRAGVEATGLAQDTDGVTVTTREIATGGETQVRARHVIGADGASSTIRARIGALLKGSDFDEPWLVIDLLCDRELGQPNESEMFCDPSRPATRVPGPGNHHRWEFMLLPGERAEDIQSPEAIGELLKPWVELDEVEILRASVYRFHSLLATRWRDRRVFLAGDAAHQTPPFLGQGLCHGIRDVHNLLSKISAVIAGGPAETLLASYETERRPHVEQIIDMAVAAGREICLLDPVAAAERDRGTRAAARDGSLPRTTFQGMPPLSHGLITNTAGAGELFPQPDVHLGSEQVARFDDVIDPDVAVVARGAMVEQLDSACEALGVTLVDAAACAGVADWFDLHSCQAAVVRPDRYVYGTSSRADDAEQMIRQLRMLYPTAVVVQ
jgi:3-(3-hydroxy-phenyl)propionate hydroxylase